MTRMSASRLRYKGSNTKLSNPTSPSLSVGLNFEQNSSHWAATSSCQQVQMERLSGSSSAFCLRADAPKGGCESTLAASRAGTKRDRRVCALSRDGLNDVTQQPNGSHSARPFIHSHSTSAAGAIMTCDGRERFACLLAAAASFAAGSLHSLLVASLIHKFVPVSSARSPHRRRRRVSAGRLLLLHAPSLRCQPTRCALLRACALWSCRLHFLFCLSDIYIEPDSGSTHLAFGKGRDRNEALNYLFAL